MPPRYKAIPPDQCDALDRFWQMRRAEILADLQVWMEHEGSPPPEEVVPQSQTSFIGTTQNRMSLIHELQVAGHPATAESMTDLMHNHPVEFARVAFTSRQKNVIHDDYEEMLTRGGVPHSDNAARRIAAAKNAIADGENGVRAFLNAAAAWEHDA